MFTLAKAWIWIKEHWKIVAFFVWSILLWVFARKSNSAAIEVLEARKKSYQEQIAVLKRNHKKELTEKDKLIVQYHDIISDLEKRFEADNRKISEEHKREVEKIIETSKGNPDEVRERIEKEFGFKFVE